MYHFCLVFCKNTEKELVFSEFWRNKSRLSICFCFYRAINAKTNV